MDSRFPWMVSIDRLPDSVSGPVREVCNRESGLKAAWDTRDDYIFFYIGDDLSHGLYRYPAGRWESHIVDEILADVRTRHKPAWLKDWDARVQRENEKQEKEIAANQVKADIAPEIHERVESKRRKRVTATLGG
jgi:hypothetical protein